MPDWSYQTFLRPLLFSLSPEHGRDLALSVVGRLGRSRFGQGVIDLMGHMQPADQLKRKIMGIDFPGPVGLGAGFDANAIALGGLARFGFGFIEIGPVTVEPQKPSTPIERLEKESTLLYPAIPASDGLAKIKQQLLSWGNLALPLGIRIASTLDTTVDQASRECLTVIDQLKLYARYFSLDIPAGFLNGIFSIDEWRNFLSTLKQATDTQPLILCFQPDSNFKSIEPLIEAALDLNITAVVISGGVRIESGQREVGSSTHQISLDLVRCLRQRWNQQITIIGSGGILSGQDAIEILEAGANLIQLHSGLIYSGPGLPKRINESILYRQQQSQPKPAIDKSHQRFQNWRWLRLLGLAMIIGGFIAFWIAATRVVLPYDEVFVGLSREQLAAINPNLLPFMIHDRITLAGTMIAVGVLYAMLVWHAIQQRVHWARVAYVTSTGFGFASFFLFLGYGYFDPLHAFVAVILFIFFVLGLRWKSNEAAQVVTQDLHNDRRWRMAYWGQFVFIVIGIGLMLGGFAVAMVGITTVFVPSDLEFLRITAAQLSSINSRILPLIAHDRAGFGGALVSNGLAVLLSSLWGFRRGARWLWWMLLLAGTPGFVTAIGIHLVVDYIDFIHLAPAVLGVLLYIVGLVLLFPYLNDQPA